MQNRPAPDVPMDTLFEREFRGYNKRQVEDYIGWLQEQCRTAQVDLDETRARLTEAQAEIERLRRST